MIEGASFILGACTHTHGHRHGHRHGHTHFDVRAAAVAAHSGTGASSFYCSFYLVPPTWCPFGEERGPFANQQVAPLLGVGEMTNKKARERELAFVDALARAFVDAKLHPQLRSSPRLREIEELRLKGVPDAEEAVLHDTQKYRAQLAERDAGDAPVASLSELSPEERSHQLNYFDLNDDSPEDSQVNPDAVARIVLDEVADLLNEHDWWQKLRGTVRRVVVEGQSQQSVATRALSRTEELWRELLGYQRENAFAGCHRAASLAGRLFLYDWEQSGRYGRLMEDKSAADAWECPAQFFGGLFCDGTKLFMLRKLKPLFERHRNLVVAAIEYARQARNSILELGMGGVSSGPGDVPSVNGTEHRADRLIMQFFPWAEARELGLAENVSTWDKFRNDLTVFGDIHEIFWKEQGVMIGKDGVVCRLPDSECTWDALTARLCVHEKMAHLKTAVVRYKSQRETLFKRLKQEAEAAAAARTSHPGGAAADEGTETETKTVDEKSDAPEEAATDSDSEVASSDDESDEESGEEGSAGGGEEEEEEDLEVADGDSIEEPRRVTRSARNTEQATDTAGLGAAARGGGPGPIVRRAATRQKKKPAPRPRPLPRTVRAAETSGGPVTRKRKPAPPAPAKKAAKKKSKPKRKPARPVTAAKKQKKRRVMGSNLEEVETNGKSESTTSGNVVGQTGAAAEVDGRDSDGSEDSSVADKDDVAALEVRVIARAEDHCATAISAVLPFEGERFEDVKSYPSLPDLLNVESCRKKAKFVVSFQKRLSGSVYSFSQVTTAPHLTHSISEMAAIQGAAASLGLPSLSLNGDMSVVQEDATFLAPGTQEYESLGLDDALGAVDEKVLTDLLDGCRKYGEKVPLNEQKAKEHGGASRNAFNLGVGWAGHGYEKGVNAPDGEFAEPTLMNLDNVNKFFPDKGRCLGVIFEALGKAQEAITKRLGREGLERTDDKRNAKYAGEVGRRLHKPGCRAGESLFISLECSRSKTMGEVMDRLNRMLKKKSDGKAVAMHVDPQNPLPLSAYCRVVLGTWVVYFVREGEHCVMQITGILTNRGSICNRNHNNAAVKDMIQNYLEGIRRFEELYGNVRYEDDGLGLFACAAPTVVSFLPEEPAQHSSVPGTWVGHAMERDGSEQYRRVAGETSATPLTTVGDASLAKDPLAKGTSDVEDIEGSDVLHGSMVSLRENPNKMALHCATRRAAQLVADKFKLGRQHVWNLFFCHLQHSFSPVQFIAKCESLVSQWTELWAPPNQFGVAWKEACTGDGFDGHLASLFMNMTPPDNSDSMSNLLKRVTSSHVKKGVDYSPEFCASQIELLRQYGDDLRNAPDSKSTVDILEDALHRTTGPLTKLVNVGRFVGPTVHTGIFLWGLEPMPCWRASECPILDKTKKHFAEGNDDSVGEGKFKSQNSALRGLLITAHQFRTSTVKVENSGCVGKRTYVALDFLLIGMDSFDLRPTDDSHPYSPDYELWLKEYGAECKWRVVEPSQVLEVLRIYH